MENDLDAIAALLDDAEVPGDRPIVARVLALVGAMEKARAGLYAARLAFIDIDAMDPRDTAAILGLLGTVAGVMFGESDPIPASIREMHAGIRASA